MTWLAWRTLRHRWPSFLGCFIAISLGVCLLATTLLSVAAALRGMDRDPSWYSGADIVVVGANTAVMSSEVGPTSIATRDAQGVSAEALRTISGLQGIAAALPDHRTPIMIDGLSFTARPWPVSVLHEGRILSGRPPRLDNEVVLVGPTNRRPGERVVAHTPLGERSWQVVGVMAAPIQAVYLTPKAASDLARGRIDTVAVKVAHPSGLATIASSLRQVLRAEDVRVLTGRDRADAEPYPQGQLLVIASALLGTGAGVSACASVFVVAGTFAFAVAQRRREIALLRLAGATPRQVRRMVLAEAAMVGIFGALAGCALSLAALGPFARWLAAAQLAPHDFHPQIRAWPLAAAAALGILAACVSAAGAALDASRVKPIQATAAETSRRGVASAVRLLLGLTFLVGSLASIPVLTRQSPDAASPYLMLVAIGLIASAMLLSPTVAPALVKLVAAPVPGIVALLARRAATIEVRRTSATAGPIILAAGLAGAALLSTDVLSGAGRRAATERVTADLVVTSRAPIGLSEIEVRRLRALPGVRAAVPVRHSIAYVDTGRPGQYEVPAIYAPPGLASVLRLDPVVGDLAGLRNPRAVAVSRRLADAQNWRLGGLARVRLADSTSVDLRVVAILPDSLDLGRTLLLPWELRSGTEAMVGPDAVYLKADPTAAAAARAIVGVYGDVSTARERVAADSHEGARIERIGLAVVVGLSVLYTGLAIANTFAMATADRRQEFAVLRMSGAAPAQILGLVTLETAFVATTAIALAAAISGIVYALSCAVVSRLTPPPPLTSLREVTLVAASCFTIAVAASLASAATAMGRGKQSAR